MLPERLKTLRLEAKLTQKEIAQKLGISQPAYAVWENGKRNPNQQTLATLSNFFDVSVDYLLGNTDNRDYLNDSDLEKALDGFKSFDGKIMSDHDREVIRELLIEMFNDK
ncbi:transcriptional regulator [Bacilli bacterium]|nr:transcriptional regulator [Bacilli bacterium]